MVSRWQLILFTNIKLTKMTQEQIEKAIKDKYPINSKDNQLIQTVANLLQEAARFGADIATPKWVSVEDRLPEEEGEYIAYRAIRKEYLIAQYQDGRFIDLGVYLKGVTAWQPLPEPPKEK